MTDVCPFCDHTTAVVLSAVSNGWLLSCTECGRNWVFTDRGDIES